MTTAAESALRPRRQAFGNGLVLLHNRAAANPSVTIRALVRAVPRFPQVNALFDDEEGIVRRHAALHIGIATQTPQGLMVPVVRHAEALDLWEVASEITRLAAATRDGTPAMS